MTDYDNYDENLAFESIGDWSDKGIKAETTDRTQSSIELVERIERLSAQLLIAKTALDILAKNGNELAKIALNEMR